MPPDHDLIAAFHEVQEFRQLRLGTVRADVQGTLWFISWIDGTTASRLNVAQEDRPCLKCRFGNAAPEIGAGGWPATRRSRIQWQTQVQLSNRRVTISVRRPRMGL